MDKCGVAKQEELCREDKVVYLDFGTVSGISTGNMEKLADILGHIEDLETKKNLLAKSPSESVELDIKRIDDDIARLHEQERRLIRRIHH